MITWSKHRAAIVGSIQLTDGTKGNAVVVGAGNNPKGAVIILFSDKGEQLQAKALSDCLDSLSPQQVIDIRCAQERVYGKTGLKSLEIA